MAVDKNLFPYDLAVVAILWNEGHYLKEWLDYHLLAGVDHFYLYDHESTDNYNEIIKPYVDAGIVTSVYYPGKRVMYEVYNDAVHKYRFSCKYLAVIDGDEFIFPQNNKSIPEVLDEILAMNPSGGGLSVNWQYYGSNFQEKADYSKGVLERFTRRAKKDYSYLLEEAPGRFRHDGNACVKNIINPRRIDYINDPHFIKYLWGYSRINEQGKIVTGRGNTPEEQGKNIAPWGNFPIMHDKIVINHYHVKSREEFYYRKSNGDAIYENVQYDLQKRFEEVNKNSNDEFDDSILKYRENRIRTLIPQGGGYNVLESLAASKQIDNHKLCAALLQNLAPIFSNESSKKFFEGKLETFLTCQKSAEYLRKNVLQEKAGTLFEETALQAVNKTLQEPLTIADVKLMFSALPEILRLDYPVVEEIRKACINLVPHLMTLYRMNNLWGDFNEMYYFGEMLKTFDNYNHK